MARVLLAGLLLLAGLEAAESDWHHWRGPDQNGVARGDAPLTWSDSENVNWKTEIPGRGNSSPVIWDDRVFLTTAVPTGAGGGALAEHAFVVMCLDRNTGEVLWEKTAITATPHEGHHPQYGSFASQSAATDGEHVIAFFGSRGVYAYDLEGTLAWQKDFDVKMEIFGTFGEGSAPVLHGETLLLNFDHQGDSFIVALNKNTGEELWRRSRDENTSWTTPLVVEHGGRAQAIVSATNKVVSYDLKTGDVIWECAGLGGNVIPTPVHDDGIVYVMSGFRDPNLLAIRLGATGDLTGTDAVLWTNTRGLSYTPSPVLHDGKLYVLTNNGIISCFDAATGEPYYHQQRLPKPYNFKASPVAANGKLYLASEEGDIVVLKLGEEYEVLATNTLTDQVFIASPAITDGEIYLRGQNTLYAIAE